MPEPRYDEGIPTSDTEFSGARPHWADEAMEDEEKVMAGHADVNMPALLTKDVLGG